MRLKLLFVFLSALLVVSSFGQGVPVGAVIQWIASNAPSGWLVCSGGYISTNTYSNLFSVIGYTYGGSVGNFGIPDMRSRVSVGMGTGAFLTARNLRDSGGVETVTLTVAQMPSHSHSFPCYVTPVPGNPKRIYYGDSAYDASYSSSSAGSDQAHENMPPYLVLNYIIKAFPDIAVTNYVVDTTFTDLNEALVWRLKSSLWIFGGLCALTCSVCFFARS